MASTGLLIPLYTYPTDGSWSVVRETKLAHPSVPILAVTNPHNGPGETQNDSYVRGIHTLQSGGVVVLGYVYTSYAKRDIEQVKADITSFHSWYQVDGIFLDNGASTPGAESYYSALTEHAKSLGMSLIVVNPGTRAPSYVGTADLLVAYEHGGIPSISRFSGLPGDRNNYALIAYDVPALDPGWLSKASGYVSYLFVTDKGLPNPYGALPSYFEALVAVLAEV